jgi:hypothetical protein
MSVTRRGDWMQTYTGRQFWPLDLRPEDVDVLDIAAALGKLCRYGGHCLRFYSVAEHCALMARHAPPEAKLAALMHDAAEAYLVDVPRAIKPTLHGYEAIEERVLQVICARFDIDYPFPPVVKELDNRILNDESRQNMAPHPAPWTHQEVGNPLGIELEFWGPGLARSQFLSAFHEHGGKR